MNKPKTIIPKPIGLLKFKKDMPKQSLLLLAILFLGLSKWSFAQDKILLKPADLVDLAIQNSKTIKISKSQIEAAKARLAQSKDRNLPFIGISGSYYRFANPTITPSSSLASLLGGGGSNNGNSAGGNGSASSHGFPSVNQATLLQAAASENIFSGFKNKYSIEADNYLVKAAEFKLNGTQDEVVLNALSAFYNIFKLQTNQYVVNQDLEEQNRRIKDFENLEKNGLLTRNDLLKAEVQATNIKIAKLDIDNALEQARFNLKIILGIPGGTSLEIDTTTNLFKDRTVKSKEELTQFALDHRNDLLSEIQESESYKSRVKVSKNAYYPSISLTGGYVDAFLPGLIDIKNVLDASIGLKYNLTNLFTNKHQVEEARANLGASMASYENAKDQVRTQVNQAYLSYFEDLKKVELEQDIINQAAENYKILKNKYANSLSTLTDLLDGELSLLQARLNQTNAKADEAIAYFNLIRTSGITLTKDQIN